MPIFSQGWDFGWNAMFRNGSVRTRQQRKRYNRMGNTGGQAHKKDD